MVSQPIGLTATNMRGLSPTNTSKHTQTHCKEGQEATSPRRKKHSHPTP